MKTVLLFFLLFMYPGKRHILIFYNENGMAARDRQLSLLSTDKDGIAERDISIRTCKISEEKVMADKWKIKYDATFVFILIGKDGGEKMRSDTVVSLSQLYKTIDAMPMRRNEMKEHR